MQVAAKEQLLPDSGVGQQVDVLALPYVPYKGHGERRAPGSSDEAGGEALGGGLGAAASGRERASEGVDAGIAGTSYQGPVAISLCMGHQWCLKDSRRLMACFGMKRGTVWLSRLPDGPGGRPRLLAEREGCQEPMASAGCVDAACSGSDCELQVSEDAGLEAFGQGQGQGQEGPGGDAGEGQSCQRQRWQAGGEVVEGLDTGGQAGPQGEGAGPGVQQAGEQKRVCSHQEDRRLRLLKQQRRGFLRRFGDDDGMGECRQAQVLAPFGSGYLLAKSGCTGLHGRSSCLGPCRHFQAATPRNACDCCILSLPKSSVHGSALLLVALRAVHLVVCGVADDTSTPPSPSRPRGAGPLASETAACGFGSAAWGSALAGDQGAPTGPLEECSPLPSHQGQLMQQQLPLERGRDAAGVSHAVHQQDSTPKPCTLAALGGAEASGAAHGWGLAGGSPVLDQGQTRSPDVVPGTGGGTGQGGKQAQAPAAHRQSCLLGCTASQEQPAGLGANVAVGRQATELLSHAGPAVAGVGSDGHGAASTCMGQGAHRCCPFQAAGGGTPQGEGVSSGAKAPSPTQPLGHGTRSPTPRNEQGAGGRDDQPLPGSALMAVLDLNLPAAHSSNPCSVLGLCQGGMLLEAQGGPQQHQPAAQEQLPPPSQQRPAQGLDVQPAAAAAAQGRDSHPAGAGPGEQAEGSNHNSRGWSSTHTWQLPCARDKWRWRGMG